MTRLYFLILICCLCFFSCKNKSVRQHTGIDTAQIITQIFSTGKITEGIPSTVDTIYLIKSKKFPYYNTSWPKNVGKLKTIYLEETLKNTEPPHFGSKLTDKPIRYVVTRFFIKADSANVWVYGINYRMDYYYKLVKKNGNWQIAWSNWAIE